MKIVSSNYNPLQGIINTIKTTENKLLLTYMFLKEFQLAGITIESNQDIFTLLSLIKEIGLLDESSNIYELNLVLNKGL